MKIKIREMKKTDWEAVSLIYKEGIETKTATFQNAVPDYFDWDKEHMKPCRFIAETDKSEILGWAALSPVSSRCVYQGVAEISIYVKLHAQGNGIGKMLLLKLVEASEAANLWTLQSSIISTNTASIHLHQKCGFRLIGYRQKIAQDMDGIWQNIVLFERRANMGN